MTLLLWGVACVLWAIALYGLCRVPSRPSPPPEDFVSKDWLASFRRSREE